MIFVLASQFHNKKALVWAFSMIVSENRWIDCSSTHNPLPGNCIMELLGPGHGSRSRKRRGKLLLSSADF